ncbi:Os11g0707100, partial [Oryza sativa Japonica Group]
SRLRQDGDQVRVGSTTALHAACVVIVVQLHACSLIMMSAGEPAKLIRQRYREAADMINKGKMCVLFINDLDAGRHDAVHGEQPDGERDADEHRGQPHQRAAPRDVQPPSPSSSPATTSPAHPRRAHGQVLLGSHPRGPHWRVQGHLPQRQGPRRVPIDFFGALRARVYGDEVRRWVAEIGVENIGRRLVNSAGSSWSSPR